MKRVVRHLPARSRVERDVELSLSQAERHSFAALIDDHEHDDLLSHFIRFLSDSPARFISEDAPTVHQDKTISRLFPRFGYLQFDLRVNPSFGIALAALAENGPVNDCVGFLRQLLNRERPQLRCAQAASAKKEQAK